MAFPRKLRELCTPAVLYLVLSMVGLMTAAFQNIGNQNIYNLGSFSARVPSTLFVFIAKLIYILFWTWILNLICKDGHTEIAWLLVLVPFIILFAVISLLMLSQ